LPYECAQRGARTQDVDVPEGLNVEVAHNLTEKEDAERRKHRWEEVAEVIEVLVLALAAIATAWSGFQASQADDRRGLLYGQATTQRFAASAASTLGGQQTGRGLCNVQLLARGPSRGEH
jgi:Mn2+/Fe2+ NRAMP family transporter